MNIEEQCRWGSKSFEPSARSASGDRDRGGFGERGGFGDRDKLPNDRSRDRDSDISRADTEDKWSRRAPVAGMILIYSTQEGLNVTNSALLRNSIPRTVQHCQVYRFCK